MDHNYILEAKNIYKKFGSVIALKGVNFEVKYKEVIGLIGDNGAGKSTLINILSGLYPPDKGEIWIKGRLIKDYNVKKARELGIETIYQKSSLVENHTVWRNIFMNRELTNSLGFIKIDDCKKITEKLIRDIGLKSNISADSIVRYLSGGERQGIAIARTMIGNKDLLLLDEPTANLSLIEVDKVLTYIKEIKNIGRSCVFVTHNIYHVYDVADRFIIIDRGEIKGEYTKNEISLNELLNEMRRIVHIRHE
jgi:simple sugar transport system ATP-binding protein